MILTYLEKCILFIWKVNDEFLSFIIFIFILIIKILYLLGY